MELKILTSLFSCIIVGCVFGSVAAWVYYIKKFTAVLVHVFTALVSLSLYFFLSFIDEAMGLPIFLLALIALPWAIGFGEGNAAMQVALACQGLITCAVSTITFWMIRKIMGPVKGS